jgi:hypothetical protein
MLLGPGSREAIIRAAPPPIRRVFHEANCNAGDDDPAEHPQVGRGGEEGEGEREARFEPRDILPEKSRRLSGVLHV